MCPNYSEAKQTEKSMFGVKKGLYKGQARSTVHAQEVQTPLWFSGRSFYRQKKKKKKGGVGAAECVTFFSLVGGKIIG